MREGRESGGPRDRSPQLQGKKLSSSRNSLSRSHRSRSRSPKRSGERGGSGRERGGQGGKRESAVHDTSLFAEMIKKKQLRDKLVARKSSKREDFDDRDRDSGPPPPPPPPSKRPRHLPGPPGGLEQNLEADRLNS